MKHHPWKVLTLATAACTVLLAGCQTTNPYTREQQTSKAAKGAGIGAIAGEFDRCEPIEVIETRAATHLRFRIVK